MNLLWLLTFIFLCSLCWYLKVLVICAYLTLIGSKPIRSPTGDIIKFNKRYNVVARRILKPLVPVTSFPLLKACFPDCDGPLQTNKQK